VSELTANASFGPPVVVDELSGASNDLTPSIRHDGLEIIIASTREGTIGAQDLWVSTRQTVGEPWLAPVNLGLVINGIFNDTFPSLSSDRETLFFSSNRPGAVQPSSRAASIGAAGCFPAATLRSELELKEELQRTEYLDSGGRLRIEAQHRAGYPS
jgi:hypothetical protein